ncbi:MAG: hypothetical protein GYA59_09800 [Chloroflexi bacterium]|nr:hypothetical protein [Chloroflexota bacterium]
MRYNRLFFLLLALLLVACQAATPTPAPMPTLWQVGYTSTLSWMGPLFNTCTLQDSGVGLLVFERPASALDPQESDFSLRWGAPPDSSIPAAVIGSDELVFITHPDNPVQSLSLDDLKAIFSGTARSWEAFGTSPSEIELWLAPDGSDLQQVFQALLGLGDGPTPYGFLAPDPLAMRQAVAASPTAIGYLPARWLDESVQMLTVSDVTLEALQQPILALYNQEPQGQKKQWLLCVQNAIAEQP